GEAIVTVTVNDGEFDVSESAILAITAVNDAPVIDTIADQEIAEDTTLTVDLEVSDVDSDVEALTYTVTADAALGDGATAGDFSVDTATQTLTFVPPADFNGVLSTTVEASDGELSGSATFTLTVTAVSDAPVATGQSVEALEDTVIDIDMTLGASDADGDALTFVIDTQPAQGVVELLATGDGIARYTPAAEYAGPDGFTFHVSDGTLDSETGSVEIDVVAVNDPPVVGYAAGTTLATTSGVPVDVTFVITDPDTDTHTLELGAASPVGGTAEQTGDLTVTYTPTASFQGADTFSVTALEVDGETALASEELAVSIVVTLPNFPPTAGPSGPFTTFLNTPTTVVLVGADPEGLPLTYDIVAPPAGGTLAGEGASRVYTPNDGFTGQDSFIYQVSDGVNVSGAALVEVSVEPLPAPIVNEARTLDDIEGLVSDVPVTIQLGGDSPVFVQPQGPSADAEMSAASSAPDIAQTTLNGTVLDVLLLSAGEATVTVSTVTADAADSVSVSFNVLVTAPVEENDPPVVGRITPIVVTEGTEVTVFPSVQDPDDDAVSFEVTSVVQESGRDGDSEPSVTYDAASKSLTVGVADIGGLFAQYTVVLAVTDGINDPVEAQFIVTAESNNEPPAISAPADLVVEVGEDVSIEVTAVDPNEGDEVSISAASQATDSDVRSAVRTSLRDFNTADAAEDAGAFVHTFTFSVPEAIQGKFFTIQWTADDSLESASASTLITVGADVNLPPVIDAIANIEVDEGGSAEATVSASDPEGGEVTLTVDGLPDGATFDAASGTVSWPEISYESAGTHALTVTALDDADQVATSGFSVTVTDVNLAPALVFASLDGGDGEGVLGSIEIQQTVESQFVVKGSDLDGDDVTLGASGVPEWVRFSLVDGATGPELTLAFEAPLGTEDFSFTLSVTDTGQLKTEAEVSAVVTEAPNEAPEFADLLSQTATEEEPFEVTIGVTDPNEDEVTLTVAPQPDGATITKVDDEAFVFVWTPAIGDAQDDPVDFTFTADDGREEGTSTATLMVTVQQGENFPPVVPSPEPVSLLEDEEVLIDLLAGVTDPNEDPLTVDIETEFPADRLVFAADDTTAELTLRPEVGDAGTYTVKFTVRDDREGETARTILVTVLAADGGLGAGFDIAAGYSDPATGTIEDAYTFIAVVVNADETAPESVLLTVDDGNGTTLEGVTMTATGDGDLLTGATYSTELRLGVGEYSMSVLATIGAESATFEGDGPTVNPALIEISDLTAQGSSGQIPVTFTIVNPNPEGSATVTVEYQATDGGAWVAATTLGSLAGLASGGQQVVWDTLIDAPAAKNQAVSLRVVPGTGLAATTSLRLTNVAPAAPTLSAVASSPTEAVTVSGTSDTGEAAVTFLNADGQTLGSSTVGADGTFSANLTLAQGSNRITATATLGLVSEPSSPIEVIVDAIPPVLAVVSPERASTVSSLTPVISASADFGISAGDIDASEIRLNGRPISITFDENTGTFSGTKELVDQRIYLVTFEAKKTNGLSSTLSWTFTVDLTAGDETAPLFVSSSPEGDVASAQEISVVVRDGESGIDPDSVSVTLNGETLAADYLPSDDRGGTATATLAEELPAGDYTVEATFADKAGNAGTGSGTFSVITDVAGASFGTGDSSSAPNQAGNPDANFLAVVNTSPFTIDGAAPKDTEIAFFVNGQIVGVTVATESNTWAFDVPLDGDGEKLIQLQTRDDLGNVSPLSAPVSVLYDTTTPTIGFVTPSVTGNLQPDFTGTVTDGLSGVDPASISIELDGSDSGATLVYDADIGSFSATPDAAFDTGSAVTVRVTASDFAGNESVFTSEVAFDERLADVQAPSLLNPQIDGVRLITGFTPHIRGETATIQFGVTDDLSGVASVIGTLNGEDIAFTIAGDIATLEISDIQPDFHNVLLVRATDNRGNEGDIRLFEFERDAATDAFTLDVPSITNETDFVITGSGIEKGASVTVFVNETPTPAFVEGTTFRTSAVRLREGANSVAATATDEVGNTADADPIDVRLDTVAPQVAFVDPVADSVVLATTQTIRARVSDLNGIDPDSVLLLIDEVAVAATVNVDGGVEFTAPEPF
ncbi:tandem-95 repeat protein, partial [Candidatus Poribacteria bacterium]|nr:tandem-95 repeat protein [Candidatus Poribacteria bacterium]